MDQLDPHVVCGLKQIQVDSISVVGGVWLKCVFPAMLHKPAKFAMAATCVGWSNNETKALFLPSGL